MTEFFIWASKNGWNFIFILIVLAIFLSYIIEKIKKKKEDEMPDWQGGGNSTDQSVNTGDEIVEVDPTLGSEGKLQPLPLDPTGENEPNVTSTPSA